MGDHTERQAYGTPRPWRELARPGPRPLCHDKHVSTQSPAADDRTPLAQRSPDALASYLEEQRTAYARLQERGLKLDLTRGKPSTAQLDLSDGLLTLPHGVKDGDGVDVRNYGGLAGIRELRELFAELLWVDPDQVVAGGNSSLTMMHDVLVQHLLHGGVDSPRPWKDEDKVTFVCPVPGYDRHFTMLASYGIEMVTVPMLDDGPDVAAVEALVKDDPTVKGMWIVPTYANPAGSVITQEVAGRLASMPTAAPDFRIFWDNAYAFHHLTEDEAKSADILSLASAAGHPHRPIMFASTSKITYAGAGVAFLAASRETVAWYLGHRQFASIGPDKVNQLRHVQFFGSPEGVREHMRQAPGDARAEVRGRGRRADRRARRARRGRVDPPGRRLLRQPRRARRVRGARRRAGQGGRHRADPGGGVVPPRARPARPQHPAGAVLPRAGRGRDRDGRCGDVRRARHGGAARRHRVRTCPNSRRTPPTTSVTTASTTRTSSSPRTPWCRRTSTTSSTAGTPGRPRSGARSRTA